MHMSLVSLKGFHSDGHKTFIVPRNFVNLNCYFNFDPEVENTMKYNDIFHEVDPWVSN